MKQKDFVCFGFGFSGWASPISGKAEAETDKSFLLLFFKKEDLSAACPYFQPVTWAVTKKAPKNFCDLARVVG